MCRPNPGGCFTACLPRNASRLGCHHDDRIRVGSCDALGAARDGFAGGFARSEGKACADGPNRKVVTWHHLCRDRSFYPHRWDHQLEAVLVEASPSWLTNLTT